MAWELIGFADQTPFSIQRHVLSFRISVIPVPADASLIFRKGSLFSQAIPDRLRTCGEVTCMKIPQYCDIDRATDAGNHARFALANVKLIDGLMIATTSKILARVPYVAEEGDVIPEEGVLVPGTAFKHARTAAVASGLPRIEIREDEVVAHGKGIRGVFDVDKDNEFPKYENVLPAHESDAFCVSVNTSQLYELAMALGSRKGTDDGSVLTLVLRRDGFNEGNEYKKAIRVLHPKQMDRDGVIMPITLCDSKMVDNKRVAASRDLPSADMVAAAAKGSVKDDGTEETNPKEADAKKSVPADPAPKAPDRRRLT